MCAEGRTRTPSPMVAPNTLRSQLLNPYMNIGDKRNSVACTIHHICTNQAGLPRNPSGVLKFRRSCTWLDTHSPFQFDPEATTPRVKMGSHFVTLALSMGRLLCIHHRAIGALDSVCVKTPATWRLAMSRIPEQSQRLRWQLLPVI